MKVIDVMTRKVITVSPGHSVRHAAQIMLENRLSGLPVIDAGELVGVISEGDMMRRIQSGASHRAGPWAASNIAEGAARDFVATHSLLVGDAMTRSPVFTSEDADVSEVASIMSTRGIKRLPVMRDGQLVGLVSRADLLIALLGQRPETIAAGDAAMARAVRTRLAELHDVIAEPPLVIVTEGVVSLWGTLRSEAEREAVRVVLDSVPNIGGVKDHTCLFHPTSVSEAPAGR
ncbi:MAG: CBS domain-containing protein [Devosia sp.]